MATTDFAALRAREFSRLDAHGEAYLDYTGSALYAESTVQSHLDWLRRGVFGNPHSDHRPSRRSGDVIESARRAVLNFVDASDSDYAVCFTANASAAIKLVAESYPFGPCRGLVLTADNHNSVNGMANFARRADAPIHRIPLNARLRLQHPEEALAQATVKAGLFAYPAQSNFSGVKHPLSLIAHAQALGFEVLLDAAALVATTPLSLRTHPADFVALSLYKITGYPTGVGALVARRAALAGLRRPWFAGGTVEFVSLMHDTFAWREGHEGFEDGTPDFLSLAAVPQGLAFVAEVDADARAVHVASHTTRLVQGLQGLRHPDGRPRVCCYGVDEGAGDRGNTVAFNVLDRYGRPLPYALVEKAAAARQVALRGGCFCNPGAAEAAFGWPADLSGACLREHRETFSVQRFSECVGPDYPVGAVRASVGIATNAADVDRALEVVASLPDGR